MCFPNKLIYYTEKPTHPTVFINKQKMYSGICMSPTYPPKFIYIDIFWT